MSKVELVIFDLDGTLLNTEQLVAEVARAVVQRHGKSLTLEAIKVNILARVLPMLCRGGGLPMKTM